MKLTYVRWSMTIIESMGQTIVTDPVFRMLGIHQKPRTYTFDRMPRPDLVFISHTHVDHFSPSVLRRLPPGTPVWIPAGKEHRAAGLSQLDLRAVREWETIVCSGLSLTAVPAQHPGGELGLVVEGDRTVYFAGDTSLHPANFRAIGDRWALDAVLLPIGSLRSLGISFRHIGPKSAPRALRLLGEPGIVVPTHYSGMSLAPLIYFAGNPRKLAAAIHSAELGTLVGTSRPAESIEF